MCGWPSGVGYPPADGELEKAAVAQAKADAEPVDSDHDHVGVQLDALAGMVARQGQPLASESTDAMTTDAPVPAPSEGEPRATEEVPAAAASQDVIEPTVDDDVDPLTAPLAALTTDTTDTPEAPEATADIEPATSAPAEAVPTTDEAVAENPAPAPDHTDDRTESPASPTTTTVGRAAAILRPAQLLIIGTAVLNLLLAGLGAVWGPPSGTAAFAVLAVALVTLAVWTGAAVTFLHWVSRAHTHVAMTAAAPQRHGSSMSLLGWFIPIAGFVIGYRVLQDLWTGSDPSTRDDADAAPAKARMIDVWLLGIVTAGVFGYAMPVALGESTMWGALSALGLLVAALSLVSVMTTISTWQTTTPQAAESQATANELTDDTHSSPVEAAPQPVSVSAE